MTTSRLRSDAAIPASLQSFLSLTLAVIVLYRRAPGDTTTLQTLGHSLESTGSVLDLIIHDNSPVAHTVEAIPACFNVHDYHDPANPGVAKAYNEGARVARAAGKKWLLLLDQDTLFPAAAGIRYAGALSAHPQSNLFAPRLWSNGVLCSPCGYRGGVGYHLREADSGSMQLQGRSLLNSGILVSLEAFDAIGGFDERIPLDFADHDFCRRFAKLYGNACIIDVDCEHGFSDREEASLESALSRFAFYCLGARYSVRSLSDYLSHLPVVSFRCTVLSLRYRTLRFIPVMLKEMFL